MLSQTKELDAPRSHQERLLTKSDLSLLGIATTICVAVAYLLISDFSFFQTSLSAKGKPIAEIISIKNSVKRRPADEPLWSSASNSQSLYQRDHIYTDDNSSVRIAFGSDSEIDIEENALVILEQTPDAPIIKVNQGSVIARTQSSKTGSNSVESKIRVRVGDSDAIISGNNTTAIVASSQTGKPTISLVSGNAQVSINGQSTNLKANQSVEVDSKAKTQKVIQLPSFTVTSPNRLNSAGQPMSFSWKSNSNLSQQQIQIAKTNSFAEVIEEQSAANGGVYNSSIKTPGSYAIRLAVRQSDSEPWLYSVPVSYAFFNDIAPVLTYPTNGQQLTTASNNNASSYLDWQPVASAPSYQIQLSVDPDFKNLVLNKKMPNGPLAVDRLIAGSYYWRARTLFNQGAGQWSASSEFVVKDAAIRKADPSLKLNTNRLVAADIPSPTIDVAKDVINETLSIVQPPNGTSVMLTSKQSWVDIYWNSTFGTDRYWVEISRSKDFTKMAFSGEVTGSIKRFKATSDDQYFVRVKPIVAKRKLEFSEIMTFYVEGLQALNAKRILNEAPNLSVSSEQLERRGRDPKAIFQWNKVSAANSYQFELANDEKFEKIILKKNQSKLTFSTNLGGGQFYARVAGISKESGQGPWSETRRITVNDINQITAPILITPIKQTYVYRALEPDIKFLWKPVSGAESYAVEIARDENFANKVDSKTTDQPSLSYALRKGQYFWRVEAIGANKSHRTTSKSASFTVSQDMTRPTLKMPADKMIVDFDNDEPRILKFIWETPADLEEVTVVVATDMQFEDVVGRLPAPQNSISLNIKSDGMYFWFVEGKDKRERVTLRSEIAAFEVQTTKVQIQRKTDESMRIEAIFNPTSMTFSHKNEDGTTSKFNTQFLNAYMLALRGWVTESFGIEGDIASKKGDFSIRKTGTVGKSEGSAHIYDANGILRYRMNLAQKSYPISLGFRFGYRFSQVLSLFDNDETSTSVQSSNLNNVVIGLETTIPLGGSVSLESKLDYLYLVSSYPITVSKQSQYVFGANLVYQFLRHGILGYGILYRSQNLHYNDPGQATEGTINSSDFGMLYSIGWLL